MAKTKTAEAPKKKKKAAAKAGSAKDGPSKGSSGAKKSTKAKTAKSGFEALMKLADHPLVADLLAVGAMAAVAAIAEQGISRPGKGKATGSTKAVKAAGQAAAAAIGKRLMAEVGGIKKAAKAK